MPFGRDIARGPKGDYALEEVDGGTRLTFALRAELGGIKKLLMGGAIQKTMDAEVEATERLKLLLESMPRLGSTILTATTPLPPGTDQDRDSPLRRR